MVYKSLGLSPSSLLIKSYSSPPPIILTMSSPTSSYVSASMGASSVPSAAHGIQWSMPSSGPEDYPPSVGPDEYTIINPDFWVEGVNPSKFKGWSNLNEVSVWFDSY